MTAPSLWAHLRDLLILPFTVTVVVPYFIYNEAQVFAGEHIVVKAAGFVLLLSGLGLLLYTNVLFRVRGKGSLSPWTPTKKLVVEGPYRYCRNPMITGVFFMLLGECLILNSAGIAIWSAAFFCINTLYFIFREEPDLYKRFGHPYLEYKSHVPRWIPRMTPYGPQKKSLHEN